MTHSLTARGCILPRRHGGPGEGRAHHVTVDGGMPTGRGGRPCQEQRRLPWRKLSSRGKLRSSAKRRYSLARRERALTSEKLSSPDRLPSSASRRSSLARQQRALAGNRSSLLCEECGSLARLDGWRADKVWSRRKKGSSRDTPRSPVTREPCLTRRGPALARD